MRTQSQIERRISATTKNYSVGRSLMSVYDFMFSSLNTLTIEHDENP